MHTFLVAAGIGRDLGPTLDRARRTTEALMPRLGTSVTAHCASFSTIDGGWFYFCRLRPPRGRWSPSTGIGDRPSSCPATSTTALAWPALLSRFEHLASPRPGGGAATDRLLFSVLIDLTSASLFVVSDPTGRRALRYFCSQELLLISNRDLPIIATGLCELNFDLVSAASIVSCGWSMRGASLVQNLQVCDSHSYVDVMPGVPNVYINRSSRYGNVSREEMPGPRVSSRRKWWRRCGELCGGSARPKRTSGPP